MKLFSKEQFIIQLPEEFHNIYDYSKVEFPVKLTDKITVIDKDYGEFLVRVNRHIAGSGNCQRGRKTSAMARSLTTAIFIERSNKKHGNFYDYSKSIYTGIRNKVCIIDPEYGEFWQSPMGHLSGQGHPSRGKVSSANKRRKTVEQFIKESKKLHGDLYDYSKVVYTHCDVKVCIIDPEYGEFWQTPFQHLNSHGCPLRTREKKWEIHYDHIIPLSILRASNKTSNKWFVNRPLYMFLNSQVNLTPVSSKFNIDKSDLITINGRVINASSVRNNYKIIAHLITTLLNVDPTDVIKQDQEFVDAFFGI